MALRGAKRRSNPFFLVTNGLLRFARNDGQSFFGLIASAVP
jgi:hypothetical protein